MILPKGKLSVGSNSQAFQGKNRFETILSWIFLQNRESIKADWHYCWFTPCTTDHFMTPKDWK